MFNFIKLFVSMFLLCNFIYVANADAATIKAASASYSDVAVAVSSATYGDTVVVPAGSATWSKQLKITKYITLQGAGIGRTVVTAAPASEWKEVSAHALRNSKVGLIAYGPDATSRKANGLFRVTGFTFDSKVPTKISAVKLSNGKKNSIVDQLRIDHNRFHKVGYGVRCSGMVHGLVDNNIFERCSPVRLIGSGNASWERIPLDPGSKNSVYIENNEMKGCHVIASGGGGGRYVLRYNRIDNQQCRFPILDAHGNQRPARGKYNHRSMMIVEVYRNTMTNLGGAGAFWLDLRGGTGLVFGNTSTSAAGKESNTLRVQLREEDSSDRFSFAPTVVLHNGVYYECIANHTSGSNKDEPGVGANWTKYWKTEPNQTKSKSAWETKQAYVYYPAYDMIKNTFLWNNRHMGKEFAYVVRLTGGKYKNARWYLRPDRDYWTYNADFEGSSGVGVGAYSQMQKLTKCSEGVGFWVTDRGDWNTLGEDGVLYRYTKGQWVKYYEPFAYPHPLTRRE